MTKFLLLVAFAVIMSPKPLAAQIYQSERINYGAFTRKITKIKTKGSPYLTQKWLKGKIILKNSAKTKAIPIRYNIAKNTVEYKRNGEKYIINGAKVDGFIILTNKKDVIFKNGFSGKDISSGSLLRVIYNGTTKFLAHYTANLIKDIPTYGTATTVNAYARHMNYYLLTADNEMIEIKLKKDDILDAFNALGAKKKTLKKFVLNNSIDLSKEKGVRRILRYYDNTFSN